jgi:hypothetical protein
MKTTMCGSVVAVLSATAFLVACGTISEPQEAPSRIALSVLMDPEVIDRVTGRTISRSPSYWTGEAIVRGGEFDILTGTVTAPAVLPSTAVVSWSMDDTTVAQVINDFGFTPGAHPDYSAPIDPPGTTDTVSSVVDGVLIQTIRTLGANGQPLAEVTYKAGVLFATVTNVWLSSPTGGYQLYRTYVWDYSQPDVVVRTSITVTSGNVVIFTDGSVVRPQSQPSWTASALPFIAIGGVVDFVRYCASGAAGMFLPGTLYAQPGSCLEAWIRFGTASLAVAGASWYVVAFPVPVYYAGYVVAVANMVRRGRALRAACGYK